MTYQENRTASVATYGATDPNGDTISWSLPNTTFETDRGDFSISSGGVLSFKSSPNYESPHDSDQNNVYKVTVRASDGRGGTDDRDVTVTVTNVEEPGGVGLSSTSPQVGTVITAALFDLDGSVTNETWQWQRSPDGAANWSDIPGATGNTYTVTDDDLGKWLRATVAYDDGHGPGKSATSAAVAMPPPTPTGLAANGWLRDPNSPVWWSPVSGAASYELDFAVETCPYLGQYTEAVPCTTGFWQTEPIFQPTSRGSTIIPPPGNQSVSILLSRLQLAEDTLYRLRVRALNSDRDPSGWSEPAFVYASNGVPMVPEGLDAAPPWPQVATAPLLGFQGGLNNNNEHTVKYVVYTNTMSADYGEDIGNVTAGDITAAINTWMHLVKRRPDANVFSFMQTDTIPEDACKDVRNTRVRLDINEAKFVTAKEYDDSLCAQFYRSCYRSRSLYELELLVGLVDSTIGSLDSLYPGRMMLRGPRYDQDDLGFIDDRPWNATITGGSTSCNLAQHAFTHEMGHALGIGLGQEETGHLGHPYLREGSLMSNPTPNANLHCRPQAYDIVAIMAIYQHKFPIQ